MSAKQVDPIWIKSEPLLPCITSGEVVRINSNEFIIASNQTDDASFIYKFNSNLNECKVLMEYPEDLEVGGIVGGSYDKVGDKLYLMHHSGILIIDHPLQSQLRKTEYIPFDKRNYNNYTNPCFVASDKSLHFMHSPLDSAVAKTKHFMLKNDKKSEEINEFPEYSYMAFGTMIYVSSKEILVFIGGFNQRYENIGIWIFNLKSRDWKQIKKSCPWKRSRAVITSDQKYIIIATSNDGNTGDEIYVLNIDDSYKLNKCNIHCPKPGNIHCPIHIVRSGHKLEQEMLVIGWIKSLFRSNDFKHLRVPPVYILQLIARWYNQEMLHWLERNCEDTENEHYMISIKHILSSINSVTI